MACNNNAVAGSNKLWNNVYRKEDATFELLTKVAKVLLVIDGGEDIKNKNIDALIC